MGLGAEFFDVVEPSANENVVKREFNGFHGEFAVFFLTHNVGWRKELQVSVSGFVESGNGFLSGVAVEGVDDVVQHEPAGGVSEFIFGHFVRRKPYS